MRKRPALFALLLTAGLLIPSIALPAAAAAPAIPGPDGLLRSVDLELVLAIDTSGSVDEEEGRLQRKGYIEAFTAPEVIAAIRSGRHKRIAVTYYEWAGQTFQNIVVPWTLIDGKASAAAFALELQIQPVGVGPYTSISDAITSAMPLFVNNGFEAPRQVIDISGDGPNNSGRLVTPARAEALKAGLTINGLPIMNDRPSRYGNPPMPDLDLYYKKCVIGGPRSFIVVAEDFRSFARAIRKKLVLEISGAPPKLFLAATTGPDRVAPDCDAGERRRRSWSYY